MVKRLVSLGAAVCILFAFLCIPASAASVSGSCDLGYGFGSLSTLQNGGGTFKTKSISYPGTSNAALYSTTSSVVYGGLSSLSGFSAPSSFDSNLVITFSYYLTSYNYSTFSDGDYSITRYWNDTSGEHSATDSVESTFWDAPTVPSGTHASKGVTIKATFSATEDNPFTNPRLDWNPALLCGRLSKDTQLNYNITSFRVITTSAPSGELLELENIAALIAQTNSILTAMYGDILAVCNSIYERTGSILEAQQKTNELFASIIPVLNSLNTNVANIYSTLTTYFDLVLKAIDNQTVTLDQSIKDAEKALETYLKPMIDYFNQLQETTGESASTLPGHKADLDGFASDSNGIDDDAVSGLASLLPVFSAFSFVFSVLGIFVGLGIFLLIIRKGLS